MVEKDFKKMLYENALKVNVQLSDSQLDLFYKYKELVIEWNKNINLTAITDDVDFAVKHFVDSITIDKYIHFSYILIDKKVSNGTLLVVLFFIKKK